jgi:hypothetical protein
LVLGSPVGLFFLSFLFFWFPISLINYFFKYFWVAFLKQCM